MTGKVIKIREVGDPILKEVCKEADLVKDKKYIKEVINNLKATFEYIGGYGIAASQIGEAIRIVIIGVNKENCRYKEAEDVPETIMINPVIKICDYKNVNEDYEGCFSIPIIRGKVTRYNNIEVEFYNEKFEKQVLNATGYTSRLIQHECDHLDGTIFLEKVVDLKSYSTLDNIKKFELM